MRHKATIGRSEVSERLDQGQTEAREKGDEAEENVEDVELESEVLAELEGGTEEAAEQAGQCIEQAQDASESEFEQDSAELEGIHDQISEYEDLMQERSDVAAGDVERISGASSQLHRDAPRGALEQAHDALQEDIELLNDHEQRAREAREESQQRNDDQGRHIAAARQK